MMTDTSKYHWDEETSERYLDYGRYFVPEREQQMRIMVDLLRDLPQPLSILELCCGEGLLAELLLSKLSVSAYIGLDGSALMLERARRRLSPFDARVKLGSFELADHAWRRLDGLVQAVVSSLAIHHLNMDEKQELFLDVYAMLDAGGAFVVADMVAPASAPGRNVTADAWEQVVRQRSIALDGNTKGLDFFLKEGWNTYRYTDPDDIDHPSGLFEQLKWLERAGFVDIDVHFMQAGHALFSGWKK